MRTVSPGLVAICLLCLAGCGSTTLPTFVIPPAVRFATDLAPGQCRPSPVPFREAAVDSLVDSATVAGLLAQVDPAAVESMVVAVHLLPSGEVMRIHWLTSTPDSMALRDSLAKTIRRHPAPTIWGAQLALQPGPAPRLQIRPSEYCAPGPLRNSSGRREMAQVQGSQADVAGLATAGPAVLDLLIDTLGVPRSVSLAQPSGNRIRDGFALETAPERRLAPARLDGLRVWAWYRVRVTDP